MKKFVFTYHGGLDSARQDPEQIKNILPAWMAWFDTIKESIVDGGNPFGPSMSVSANGTEPVAADALPARGYTIIQASSLEEATKVAEGCPILAEGEDGAVQVHEAIQM